tara:strand:- start:4438 stop:5154 length:717 start_codon:yes stop_codon:yes gene_type:complete
MAFKFKVKKRPNLGQAVASSFAAGAVQGGQMALQKMLQEREENKKNSNKELNLYNSLINNLPQTADNKKLIAEGKLKILKNDDTAQSIFESQQDGFQYSSNVATDPIYGEDGEILAYKYGKNIIYANRDQSNDTITPSQQSVMKKRTIDITRQKVADIEKRIKELSEKESNSKLAPELVDWTERDQTSLDSLKVLLPEAQLELKNAYGGSGASMPVSSNSQSSVSTDPFSKFEIKNQE